MGWAGGRTEAARRASGRVRAFSPQLAVNDELVVATGTRLFN